jgi:hypothetical protein
MKRWGYRRKPVGTFAQEVSPVLVRSIKTNYSLHCRTGQTSINSSIQFYTQPNAHNSAPVLHQQTAFFLRTN